MMVEYPEYLAANVLNEQQLVCSDYSLPISDATNIHTGQLPLSEQGPEGPCQPSKAVRCHIQHILVASANQLVGCSSSSTRSRMPKDQAPSTLPTLSLELACRRSRNN
jgi:hypothetical protein